MDSTPFSFDICWKRTDLDFKACCFMAKCRLASSWISFNFWLKALDTLKSNFKIVHLDLP